jgi:outer membrane protein
MLFLLLLSLQAAPSPQRSDSAAMDSVPRVTLADAIRLSTRFDPQYVRALGQIDDAEWGRRAAMLAFFVPSVDLSLDETKYSQSFFNPANPANPTSTLVVGRAAANYEVFSLRKFSELSRTKAEITSAEAGELEQRYRAALETESSFYDVLVNQELSRVTDERVRRAQQALSVARARVTSGAAVQTDSLQLVLELTRAEVEGLRQRNALHTSRLELGRRVGAGGPVDAVPSDSLPPDTLPISLIDAIRAGLDQGPQFRAARATESAADASLRAQRGNYLPVLSIGGLHQRYDTQLFPGASNINSLTVTVSFPLWNNGQREIEVNRARVNRDVARAVREDLERVVRRDVTSSYEAYETSAASVKLATVGVSVARQTYQMQELRYRSGASTILDLLDAQVNLAQAEADLVQARYQARLSLARLEAILGRRLFANKDAP